MCREAIVKEVEGKLFDMTKVKSHSKDQRRKDGASIRDTFPLASHGEVGFRQGAERDIVSLIKDSNVDRVAKLIPIRHERMAQSQFSFFRGTAALQAFDLHKTRTSGIVVQACGDCHLDNFGGFETPERNLVFDINDFDETLPAPFEWDVKRLATSFVLAARSRGFERHVVRDIVIELVQSYRNSMRTRASFGVLESWYSAITAVDAAKYLSADSEQVRRTTNALEKARMATSERTFYKLTRIADGQRRFVDQAPFIYHAENREIDDRAIKKFLVAYRETLSTERRRLFDRFGVADVVHMVGGVGSVGTRCYLVLLLADGDDALMLQVKESRSSVLEPYTRRIPVKYNGRRVVVGQRLMQTASDIFLGWARGPAGRDFYVRQFGEAKVSADTETQTNSHMRSYASLCGTVLAQAHDKAAGDAATVSGYLGESDDFDKAIGEYSVAYADQVERDYAAFVQAIRSGQLKST